MGLRLNVTLRKCTAMGKCNKVFFSKSKLRYEYSNNYSLLLKNENFFNQSST